MRVPTVLEEEINYYRDHFAELVTRFKNKFVLIKGCSLVDVFDDWESAYKDGLRRFGMEPMLVHQVLAEEPVLSAPYGVTLGEDGDF